MYMCQANSFQSKHKKMQNFYLSNAIGNHPAFEKNLISGGNSTAVTLDIYQ